MKNKITRRHFIQNATLSSTGLIIGFSIPACNKPEPPGVIELFKTNVVDQLSDQIQMNPFLHIGSDNTITILVHKPEIGTGLFQSLPVMLAEELNADPAIIRIQQAPGDKSKFADQDVGGSYSVRGSMDLLRRAGATARHLFGLAAATRWGCPVDQCTVQNAQVINSQTKAVLTFGELVAEAVKFEVPKDIKLKDPTEFKYLGKAWPRQDIPLKVRGEANYGLDMKIPGMVYAVVENSPTWAGSIASVDDQATRQIKGILDIIRTERRIFDRPPQPAVAVIAENFWAAWQGKKVLKVSWNDPEYVWSTEKIYTAFQEAAKSEGKADKAKGSFSKTFVSSTSKLEASYELPFVAHSPQEPMNCLVHVQGDKVEIWAPTQTPTWDHEYISKYLGIPEKNITYHLPFVGGGFGRRLIADPVLQAADLSRTTGKPVKLVWTREDDTTQGPFRPGSLNILKGALDQTGYLSALYHKVIAPSIDFSLFQKQDVKTAEPGYEMEPIHELYDIPHFESRYCLIDIDPIPVSWWRSVYASTNAFPHESFIDELARLGQKDPFDFRRKLLAGDPRRLKVLELLEEKCGWSAAKPSNTGRGMAMTHSFGSTVAHMVEVQRDHKDAIRISRIVSVIDAGLIINPDTYRAQVEGCIAMGLTAALKDPITFTNGRTDQTNFDRYRILRIDEMPALEIHLIDRQEAPGGAGEPALPPLAPALANAIFDLTGQRLRKLPISLEAL